jgi:predicted Zn-dependent protease
MPICGTDEGIAVVMGHEVAHALAHHGAERMSQGMGASLIGEIISVGLNKKSPEVREGVLQAYGLGAQVGVMLPFSRNHESEADRIGLILMAKAGFNPEAAPQFWERMKEKSGGQAPPEFLSTHPSDERRIQQLREWMPEALKHYQPK